MDNELLANRLNRINDELGVLDDAAGDLWKLVEAFKLVGMKDASDALEAVHWTICQAKGEIRMARRDAWMEMTKNLTK